MDLLETLRQAFTPQPPPQPELDPAKAKNFLALLDQINRVNPQYQPGARESSNVQDLRGAPGASSNPINLASLPRSLFAAPAPNWQQQGPLPAPSQPNETVVAKSN